MSPVVSARVGVTGIRSDHSRDERRFGDGPVVPDVDADVELAVVGLPLLVHVAVQEPRVFG